MRLRLIRLLFLLPTLYGFAGLDAQAQPQALASIAPPTYSQTQASTAGALVVVPAFAEVRQANDEAHLSLTVEEQDKDKAAAASRVNLKMKQAIALLKRADPQAQLKTRGYYTYPIYPDETAPKTQRPRQAIAWRIGESLDLTTANLTALPATVAGVQGVLALNGLNFGLSEAAARRLDEQRIAATYQNLGERIGSIARAMGRTPGEASIETVDFEGSGAYAQAPEPAFSKSMLRSAAAAPAVVEEPSFEPGETTLQMRLVAKVRFK